MILATRVHFQTVLLFSPHASGATSGGGTIGFSSLLYESVKNHLITQFRHIGTLQYGAGTNHRP
jgi:hypothetical protein